MAPFSLAFNKAGLARVNHPVFLYYGQDDQVLLPKYNVLHIAPLIKTLIGIRMIPKAGHYIFLAPCSPDLARHDPGLCNDPPGVDRTAAHRQINADALAFFRNTLDADSSGALTALREHAGIWKAAVPPVKMKGAFANNDPIGLVAGKLIPADCSINWTDPDTHKLYCFSSATSLVYFLNAPQTLAEAANNWRALKAKPGNAR
jgi:hypothetical protein